MELVIQDPLCPSISSSETYQNNSADHEVKLNMNIESSICNRHDDGDGGRGRGRDGDLSMVLAEIEMESCSDVESMLLEHTHDCSSHTNEDTDTTDKDTVTDIAGDIASTEKVDRREEEEGQDQGQGRGQGQGQGQGLDRPFGGEESTRYKSNSNSDAEGLSTPDKNPYPNPPPHTHPLPQSQSHSQSQSRPFGDQDAMRRLGDWLREQEVSDDALSLLQQDGWMR